MDLPRDVLYTCSQGFSRFELGDRCDILSDRNYFI